MATQLTRPSTEAGIPLKGKPSTILDWCCLENPGLRDLAARRSDGDYMNRRPSEELPKERSTTGTMIRYPLQMTLYIGGKIDAALLPGHGSMVRWSRDISFALYHI